MKTECGNKLDEKLSEVLCRAVISETKSSFSDRDTFQNWLEEGERRQCLARRRKIRRIGFAAAAVFLCAILLTGSLLLSDALPPSLKALLSPEEGVAVPRADSDITYENGSIVIGGDGNGNVGTWTATFASYDDIPEKYREQIVWFEDMPEGYVLEEINISEAPNNVNFVTQYDCENDIVLVIKQTVHIKHEFDAAVLNKYDERINVDGYSLYKKKIDNVTMYSYVDEKNYMCIMDFSKVTQNKIEAMIASAKTGWNMK